MDDQTRSAVRAFYRLHKATAAVAADPHQSGALEALTNAAREANAEMDAAGLLGRPQTEILAMVKELYPHFDPQD